MTQTVGILAYGSLIDDPGREIAAVTTNVKADVTTPFKVEFARTSSGSRRGAPTLVPVSEHGAKVRARIIVLDAALPDAKDWLYRRERDQVGSALRYRHPANPGPNTIVIRELLDFEGIDVVLYTEIGATITDLSASNLARLAINSARGSSDGKDGISYLRAAKKNEIKTLLSDAYEEEIKKQTGARDLDEALRIARAMPKETA